MSKNTTFKDSGEIKFAVAAAIHDLPTNCFMYNTLEEAINTGPADLESSEGESMFICKIIVFDAHEYKMRLAPDLIRRISKDEMWP